MAGPFWFIVLVGILIFAHELGHFLFAKLFHVKVLTFSLGFGTPIRIGKFKLAFTRGETEYRVAWVPLGGFVRMVGEDPTEEVPVAERGRAFSSQTPWKRFWIIFGGPMFSILLAVPINFFVYLTFSLAPAPVIGSVEPGLAADEAGLLPGDRIVSVNDQAVLTWEEVEDRVHESGGSELSLVALHQGRETRYRLKPVEKLDETGLKLMGDQWDVGLRDDRQGSVLGVIPGSPAARAGVRHSDQIGSLAGVRVEGWADAEFILRHNGRHLLPLELRRPRVVDAGAVQITMPEVVEGWLVPRSAEAAPPFAMPLGQAYTGLEPSDMYLTDILRGEGHPAEKFGLEPGDKLVAAFGKPLRAWEQFSRLIAEKDEIELTVRHGEALKEIRFTPSEIKETNDFKQTTRKRGLGVSYTRNAIPGAFIARPHRLAYAARMSVSMTVRAIETNVRGFARIFEGRVPVKESVGSLFMIMDIANKSAKRGMGTFFAVLASISVLLGLINLLLLPPLDGGQIAFILAEVVLRRPVPVKVRIGFTYVGIALLAMLMMFAIGNDISRYWSDFGSLFR